MSFGDPSEPLVGRIALVSDDESLRSLLSGLLAAHGYHAVVGIDSRSALSGRHLLAECDIAVVDASAAYAEAVRVLRQLKTTNASIVVIFTKQNGGPARDELAASGDVLLGKPFDPRELVLLIRGMLDTRNDSVPQTQTTIAVRPISLSTLLNTAHVASREIELTDVESRILYELLSQAGEPVTRERLTRRALLRRWSPDDRSLDTHINRLRRKIGLDARGRTPLRTVRGIGYRLLAHWEPAG